MAKHALNTADIKRANQRLVLDAIVRLETTSRTQLSQMLALSKPAISDNLEKLLELGIVTEAGEGAASPSGGRKSILLQFNPEHKYIISVNLNFSNPVFAVADLDGNLVNAFDISIAEELSIEECLQLVINSITLLFQSLGEKAREVYCIAIAAPGVFDQDGQLVNFSTTCGGPAWWKVNLKDSVEEAMHLPVIVYNDVKAATIGEWMKGSGNQSENLFYFSTGLGLGSGLILRGKPFLGEGFDAGEIYDYVEPSGASFGLNLEDTICIEYLKEQCQRMRSSPFPDASEITMEQIVKFYQQGDPGVYHIVDRICQRMANIVYNFMTFLSINHVVFGGEYTPFFDCFAKNLKELYGSKNRPEPTVHCSKFGKFAGIQGMVQLARNRYFNEICQ